MGKALYSAARLQELSRFVSSAKAQKHKQTQPRLPNRVRPPGIAKSGAGRVETKTPHPQPKMQTSEEEERRMPLAQVVADCAKRWFQDTLKEAKAGDSSMQLLVGQMYCSGYGVPRDPQKGHVWISKASKGRNSVWKASDKQPGYRASESDSEVPENKAK
ncbi:hypothetical protein L6164_029785 [Bauhinia variegata]|uniref:Uncharacterized protein n=1 Tax=Bauhinia variegata TaxID=167791 RepID=A0ACB9L9W8_BAUVA|nr:hypothetical protein L6164_029785 [Bauhinia variegata]